MSTQRAVDIFSAQLRSEFKKHYLAVIQEHANEIMAAYMAAYDEVSELAESRTGPAIKGKDPSSLRNLRGLFQAQIAKEVKENILFEGDALVINLLQMDELGFGKEETDPGPPRTVDILSYYIEGISGGFAFITPQQYAARGRRSKRRLGRLGGGIMIPKLRYEQERWQEVTGFTFDDVRHPISGFPPYDGFKKAQDKVCILLSTTCVAEAEARAFSALDGKTLG